MKNQQLSKRVGKPIGKRTFTLKELAQRDFAVTPKENTKDLSLTQLRTFNLTSIQEDLPDMYGPQVPGLAAYPSTPKTLPNAKLTKTQDLTLSIEILNQLIAKEVARTVKALDLEEIELQAWVNLQVTVPKQTLLTLLRLAKDNDLDPLKEEVALVLYEDCQWQAYITVEGYAKLLNHHPAFDGITFNQSQEVANGIPVWMECTIYRKDRSQPIVVREYFEEIKGEQAIWQKMPRRMLRHRVMAQCARLAIA
jgi:hypothetical protein